MLFIDPSLVFNKNLIEPMLNISKSMGMMAKLYPMSAMCGTNRETIVWFGSTISELQSVPFIDTNIMLFHRNFINALIMKAWITCSLDIKCIAPLSASRTNRLKCCGCHKFEQSALTMITTFFYSYPPFSSSEKIVRKNYAGHILRDHEYFFNQNDQKIIKYFH